MSTAARDLSYRHAPDNRRLDHIPGDDGWPVLGRTVAVVRDLQAVCDEHLRRYGPVSRMRLMGQPGLLVTGAELYQRIHLDREDNFSCEMGYGSQLGDFYPGGLLLKDFDEHKLQRRLMQGAFKVAALDRYLEMMQPAMRARVAAWGAAGELVFLEGVRELLLEVAARCFLGLDDFSNDAARVNALFHELNAGMVSLVRLDMPVFTYGRARRARRQFDAWFAQLVAERRRDGATGDDVLSRLCRETDESGLFYPAQDVINHAIFLLFAAHDTTTSALTHLAMYLGRDQGLQDRLRAELATLPEPPTHASAATLEFTGRVFNEVLRLHPSVPMMVRRTIRDTELGGYAVPAHTVLFMPTFVNQRDPRWWTDPERFDPDRFLPERAEHRRHPGCYHPFGGGAHKCIGLYFADLVFKTLLWHLLRNWRLHTPPGYAPRLEWVPLPKPADGVPVRLEALA